MKKDPSANIEKTKIPPKLFGAMPTEARKPAEIRDVAAQDLAGAHPIHGSAKTNLERRVDSGTPIRVDYVLSAKGRAFQPVLLYLHSFGSEHFAPEGHAVVSLTGKLAKPPMCRSLTAIPVAM